MDRRGRPQDRVAPAPWTSDSSSVTMNARGSLHVQDGTSEETGLLIAGQDGTDGKSTISSWFKGMLVAMQVLTSALLATLVHASKVKTKDGDVYPYNTGQVVLASEVAKFLFCLVGIAYHRNGVRSFSKEQVWNWTWMKHNATYAVPALVYAVENNIKFQVLKQLKNSVTLAVLGHLEIPVVALLTVVVLRRRLSRFQWVGIVLLMDGVVGTQLALCEHKPDVECQLLDSLPFGAMCWAAVAAGFAAVAGVATEYLFKREYSESILVQNAKLYFFGMVFNVFAMLGESRRAGEGVQTMGFGEPKVLIIVMTMAAMGLSISGVVKHLSNLAKVFTSAAVMFATAIASSLLESFKITIPFVLAAVVVACAVYLYFQKEGGKKGAGHGSEIGS